MVNKSVPEGQLVPRHWFVFQEKLKKAGKSTAGNDFVEAQSADQHISVDPENTVLSSLFEKFFFPDSETPESNRKPVPDFNSLFHPGSAWREIFEDQHDIADIASILKSEPMEISQRLWAEFNKNFPLDPIDLINAVQLSDSGKSLAEELSGPITGYLRLLEKQQAIFLEIFNQTLSANDGLLQQTQSEGNFRQLIASLITDFECRYAIQTASPDYARAYGDMVNAGLVLQQVVNRIRSREQACTTR